jgi:hypothetical protein
LESEKLLLFQQFSENVKLNSPSSMGKTLSH